MVDADAIQIGSLAQWFLTVQTARESYVSTHTPAEIFSSYLFAITNLRDNIKCGINNDCKWFAVETADRMSTDLRQMIWCICCDNLYHLRCTGYDLSALTESQLPWICSQCRTNPMNADAQEVISQNRHQEPFMQRRQRFLKENVVDPAALVNNAEDDDENNEESDDNEETSHTVHLDNELKLIPSDIIDSLNKRIAEMEERNKRLETILEEHKQSETQAAQSSPVQTQRNIQDVPEDSPPRDSVPSTSTTIRDANVRPQSQQDTSYAKVVLELNAASTRLEAALKQSMLLENSFNVFNRNLDTTAAVQSENAQVPAYSAVATDAVVQHMSMLTLNEIRKSLPKIEQFDGKAEKWLTFQRAVDRNWREGKYSDEQMKFHIRQALAGPALARVDGVIDFLSAKDTMEFLRESFGNSSLVVNQARQKLLNVKLARPLTHCSCVEVTTLIASFIAACTYAGMLIADPTVSQKIHSQLEPFHQQGYYEFYFRKYPNAKTRVESLDVQFDYLNHLAKTLPLGNFSKQEDHKSHRNEQRNSHQLMNASISQQNSPTPSSDYKYLIRDQVTARYLGYDLSKVSEIPKRCEICSRNNHYSLECRQFKNMDHKTKIDTIKTKNLCQNCLLTTNHQAKDCTIKSGCGFKVDKNVRCTGKHHILLHQRNRSNSSGSGPYRKQQRRAQSHQNAANANQKIQQFEQQQKANGSANNSNQMMQHQLANNNSSTTSQPSSSPYAVYAAPPPATVSNVNKNSSRIYQMYPLSTQLLAIKNSSHRTLKMFRTIFYGDVRKAIGYAIGDSGAEVTLIRKDLASDLQLTGYETVINLQWTDSIIKPTPATVVKLRISGNLPNSEILKLDEVYAVEDLHLPPRSLNVEQLKQQFKYLKEVPFESYEDAIPAMIIGSRDAHLIEAIDPIIQGGRNKPIALRSKLGYTIYGGAPECFRHAHAVHVHQIEDSEPESDANDSIQSLEEIYAFSCSIDNLGIKPKDTHYSKEELKALEIVNEEMRILPNGSVELPLIWNRQDKKIPKLPDNFPMVYKRQCAQEAKLSKKPELLKAFNENFMNLFKEGYVRAATDRDMKSPWPNVWYLPMSLVVNENKVPIKTRNVYDASARYKGTSLNQELLMGPNLLVDMLAPLMRMRINKFAVTADVKSMFHRVMISERDQQCQRVLWRENTQQSMQVYILQVMLFGPKCSPFASQIVKNQTADKWSSKYPEAAAVLKSFTYMDDTLCSFPSAEQAVAVSNQCIEILKSINWDLIGFQSNSIEVLRALNPHNVKQDSIELMTMDESIYTTKVLGIAWNPKTDAFIFQVNKNAFVKLIKECGHKPTKRDQCSTIARIFDVLGFISHCTIRGKILLQRSWKSKIGWDDEIPDEALRDWLKWIENLESVSNLSIPRQRFKFHNMNEAESIELHTFCDAGKEAIASVSYFVANFNGSRQVSFVMSKAKVAPIRIKTKTEISEMPRLEMLSCLIAARLTNTIVNLHKDFNLRLFMWTDSEIVLNWLKNESIKLPKFAISPISEILETTSAGNWHHVDSKSNVADLATKFQRINFGDIDSPWFQGPSFLKKPQEHWPKQKERSISSAVIFNVNHEASSFQSNMVLPNINCPLASDLIVDCLSPRIISRWSKLVRAIARALKIYFDAMIPLLKSKKWNDHEARQSIKTNNNFDILTPTDLERAELFIIRRMQKEAYPVEYERLQNGKRISNTELLQLNVFMDENHVMRISSRVDLPASTYAQKFSPLIPKKSLLSTALLFHYHYRHRHVGLESQVAEFRSKYWMPQLRAQLKRIQSACNYCGLTRAHPVEYKMANLPQCRVDAKQEPFSVTGLDCGGPYEIFAKNGHRKKVWILIFTCTYTRFIHLHLLESMTALEVYEAIMCLWSAHGPVHQFISDHGTNFIGTANIFKSEQQKLIDFLHKSNQQLANRLAKKKSISWKFLPVQSPWFGAFYERLIGTVKRSIAEAIKDRRMTKTEFNIALQDAAHRINCRPLTHNPVDTEDEEVLTPHHLAKGRSGWPLIPSVQGLQSVPDPWSDKSQYRRGRLLAHEITKKFTNYYLPTLTKRTKWFKDFKPIKVGDLVLLIDPNRTREAWERARVINIYQSKDGNSRVADILMPNGSVRKNRSTKRLAKIELKTL